MLRASGCLVLLTLSAAVAEEPFRDPALPLDTRVNDLVSRLALDEKISLMSTYQPAIPRLGIAAFKVWNEALHGIAYRTATVFPQATGLAHTWDPELVRAVAAAISDEARVLHRQDPYENGLTFWSPVVDLARDPRWGRAEEAYGEDPYLSGAIGTAFVRGMQGDDPRYFKTVPTLKHFAGNSMETWRYGSSSNIDPRNLREYYLKPFEIIQREANVQSYMVAYNSINNLPCAVTDLIRDVVRGEWVFHGFVVTDYGDLGWLIRGHHYAATEASAAALIVKAGMDNISDDRAIPAVTAAVEQGLLAGTDLDAALRNTFRIRFQLGEFDPPGSVPYDSVPDSVLMSAGHTALARRAGRESVVLLKNDNNTLPLDASKLRSVAILGPLAATVHTDWYSGVPAYRVTPLDAIGRRLGVGPRVLYNEGSSRITLKARVNGKWVTSGPGSGNALVPASTTAGLFETFVATDLGWGCTTLRSAVSNLYVAANGGGQLVASDAEAHAWDYKYCFDFVPQPGGAVALKYFNGKYVSADQAGAGPLTATRDQAGAWELFDRIEVSNGIQAAAAAAAQAEIALVFVGNNPSINGKEDHDRPDIVLPPAQEQLIKSVCQANPKTVVVIVSSYPNAVVWAQQNVPAILYSSHGGQEEGNFLADVLFGDYSPAGRLTMTWYRSAADLPPIGDFDIRRGRAYWYFGGEPLYPFGHGLSYTSFEYANLSVPASARADDILRVSFEVRNTGSRAGEEVAQLYVRALDSKAQRPLSELKRFQRISLAPGEARRVEFTLPVSEMAYWDVRRSRFMVESGVVEIRAGASSRDIRLRGQVAIQGEMPQPRNAFAVQRAENYDDYRGVLLTSAGDGTQCVGFVDQGDWVAYRDVDFGAGVNSMEAWVSSGSSGGPIQIRLDGLDGTLAGVCTVPGTGDWFRWTGITCPVQAAGVHDLYLRFPGPGYSLLNLNWFRFAAPASAGGPTVANGSAVDAAGFTQPLLRGGWAALFGTNLASATRAWAAADFADATMPLALDGTRVQVNGIGAPVAYVSPTQVNFQVPGRVNLGAAVVQVLTPAGSSRPIPATIEDSQPSFFFTEAGGIRWATAQHGDYSYLGQAPATPAKPGEVIVLWGSGFGQTWPPAFPGLVLTGPAPLADSGGVSVTIGGRPAPIQYAGMTVAGVYQLNVVVPDLPDGDHPVAAEVNGRATRSAVYIPVRRP